MARHSGQLVGQGPVQDGIGSYGLWHCTARSQARQGPFRPITTIFQIFDYFTPTTIKEKVQINGIWGFLITKKAINTPSFLSTYLFCL